MIKPNLKLFLIFLIINSCLIFSVQSVVTANYASNSGFNLGNCASSTTTCTDLPYWVTYLRGISATPLASTTINIQTSGGSTFNSISLRDASNRFLCLTQQVYWLQSGRTGTISFESYATSAQILYIMFFRTSDASSPANRPNGYLIDSTSITTTSAQYSIWKPRTYTKTLTSSQPYLWAAICQESTSPGTSSIKVRNAIVTMTCDTSQDKITLTEKSQACALKTLITASVNCFTYNITSTTTSPYYICDTCDQSSSSTTKNKVDFASGVKGCAQIIIPNIIYYAASSNKDTQNKFFAIVSTCQGGTKTTYGKLSIPNYSAETKDETGPACRADYANIKYWQVYNNAYRAAACQNSSYIMLDLQQSTEAKGCINKFTNQYDYNCIAYKYTTNFQCIQCGSGYSLQDFTIDDQSYKRCLPVIPHCKKRAPTPTGFTCVSCELNYVLDFNAQCVAKVDGCFSYFNGACSSCIGGYQLINNLCVQQAPQCLQYDSTTKLCSQCSTGYIPQNGVCVVDPKTLPCSIAQYRNSNGVCVDGNVLNCATYESPSGVCKSCTPPSQLDQSTNKCTVVCPASPSSAQKYMIVNGICALVDVSCLVPADANGYCSLCQSGFYQWQGKCYEISSNTDSNTNNQQTQIIVDPYLTDKNGYKYTQGARGSRIYVNGPWANKTVFVDQEGNIYQKIYLTGPQSN